MRDMPTAEPALPPVPRVYQGVNWEGLKTLYFREIRRFIKVGTQTLAAPVVTALLYMLVFVVAVGGGREVHGVAYGTFVAPGLIMMQILSNAFANSSSSLLQAKFNGMMGDFMTPPLTPGELAIGFGADHVGLVVGKAGEQAQAHRRVLSQETHHRRPALQKAGDGFGFKALGRHRVEVGHDVVDRVGDPVFGLMVVQRDPQHAARHRRGPADHARLLENDYVGGAVMVCRQCGDQRRAAGAQHDHISFDIPFVLFAHDALLCSAGRPLTSVDVTVRRAIQCGGRSSAESVSIYTCGFVRQAARQRANVRR